MELLAHSGGNLTPAVGFVLGLLSIVLSPIYAMVAARARRQGQEVKARRFKTAAWGLLSFAVLMFTRAAYGF